MDTAAIEITGLSKRYTAHGAYALNDLTLTVKQAEVYGFLGPNGAGKSTTIRTLLNFIQPTEGSAKILGHDIVKDAVKIRRRLGYLSGDFKAYEKMTGQQFLDYMANLQPLKRKVAIKELAKIFNADLRKRISDLSKGNRQKIGIIQACMHEPDILILDEPTDGLDPLMQEAFYDLVDRLKAKGTTFFVSSHNLAEVKKMCDRVGIIRDGKLVSENIIADMALEASQTFEVAFNNKVSLSDIRGIANVKKVLSRNGLFEIHVTGGFEPLLKFLSGQHITHLTTKELNLEEKFMRYYGNGDKNV